MYSRAILLSGSLFAASGVAQTALCGEPTSSATIQWPDDLYATHEITVSAIETQAGVTTYMGVSCEGNPHSMTIAAGPSTFSYRRGGYAAGGEDYEVIDECTPDGYGMECTISAESVIPTSYTTSYASESVYDVTMAVVAGGPLETGTPTTTDASLGGAAPMARPTQAPNVVFGGLFGLAVALF